MERYHIIEKVGEGTYGVVFKAMDLCDKRAIALKKIRLDLDEDGIPTTAIREVSLLKQLSHRNIIRLLDVVQLPRSLYLVFDLVDTDLKQCMDTQVCGLSMPTIQSYMFQLLSGLSYCHSRRVLHRDLKPQNLLIERSTGLLRLADFGLSRTFRLPACSYTTEVVTLWYRAPEVLLGCAHCTPALDLWSVGCIFAEMLTGKPLFSGDSEIDQLFTIFRALGTPTAAHAPCLCSLPAFQPAFPKWRGETLPNVIRAALRTSHALANDSAALDLLTELLAFEPSRRPTARQSLAHRYFHQPDEPRGLAPPWPCAPAAPPPARPTLAAPPLSAIPPQIRRSASAPVDGQAPSCGAHTGRCDDGLARTPSLPALRPAADAAAECATHTSGGPCALALAGCVDIVAAAEALPTGLTPPARVRSYPLSSEAPAHTLATGGNGGIAYGLERGVSHRFAAAGCET